VSFHSKSYKWPAAFALAVVSGVLPITVSGVPEFLAIVVLPFPLGFLICRWWDGTSKRLVLALAFPLFGSAIRLASSSIHDGTNWFAGTFRIVSLAGFIDPYFRQMLLTLLFPVAVTIVATVMWMILERPYHGKEA